MEDSESDWSLNQDGGAGCSKAEPPIDAPVLAEDVAACEAEVLGLERLFASPPHSAAHSGGGDHQLTWGLWVPVHSPRRSLVCRAY